MHGWINGWVGGWMDGWIEGSRDRGMNRIFEKTQRWRTDFQDDPAVDNDYQECEITNKTLNFFIHSSFNFEGKF